LNEQLNQLKLQYSNLEKDKSELGNRINNFNETVNQLTQQINAQIAINYDKDKKIQVLNDLVQYEKDRNVSLI
jgi:hypothetical protein